MSYLSKCCCFPTTCDSECTAEDPLTTATVTIGWTGHKTVWELTFPEHDEFRCNAVAVDCSREAPTIEIDCDYTGDWPDTTPPFRSCTGSDPLVLEQTRVRFRTRQRLLRQENLQIELRVYASPVTIGSVRLIAIARSCVAMPYAGLIASQKENRTLTYLCPKVPAGPPNFATAWTEECDYISGMSEPTPRVNWYQGFETPSGTCAPLPDNNTPPSFNPICRESWFAGQFLDGDPFCVIYDFESPTYERNPFMLTERQYFSDDIACDDLRHIDGYTLTADNTPTYWALLGIDPPTLPAATAYRERYCEPCGGYQTTNTVGCDKPTTLHVVFT